MYWPGHLRYIITTNRQIHEMKRVVKSQQKRPLISVHPSQALQPQGFTRMRESHIVQARIPSLNVCGHFYSTSISGICSPRSNTKVLPLIVVSPIFSPKVNTLPPSTWNMRNRFSSLSP